MNPSSVAAKTKRDTRPYFFDWRSTGRTTVIGTAAAAKALGITEQSLGVYISRGGGAYAFTRLHPTTGEADIVMVHSPKPARLPRKSQRRDAK